MNETEIFRALADPTRRAVFERLAEGPRNATQLREGLPISQPAMSQHLAVLRQAGLIEREVARLDGHKSLYSTAFYTRDDFWRHYQGDTYKRLKGEYDPDGRLLDLYDKTVRGR